MSNFDPNSVNNLFGLWDFRSGAENKDTGLDDGIAQNGQFEGDASASGDRAHFDGDDDWFDVEGDNGGAKESVFDMDSGVIEVQFTQDQHMGGSPDTLVNRGEYCDRNDEGWFALHVTKDGEVEAVHYANGKSVTLTTSDDFFSTGDLVNAKYIWDENDGVQLVVENLTTGETETISKPTTGLNMDIGDNDDEIFTIGAREKDDGQYAQEFNGSIDYVAVYDSEATGPDGAVDGEASGELMELGYDDSNAPTNQGGDIITEDADLIYGNGGDDTIDGEGGDDTIYGDSGTTGAGTREIFQWEDAPNFGNGNDAADFTQNTGSVNITFDIVSTTGSVDNEYETTTQNTDDLDAAVNENASFESVLSTNSESATYAWEADTPIENVEFRVNDIDGDGRIIVRAWDENGNPIEVTLSDAGSGLALSNSDGVPGNDTATSIDTNYTNDSNPEHSVLVTIAGPVARWEIQHEQDGSNDTGINVTDIAFDVPGAFGEAGDDQITGGDGADEMYGEDGDDSFIIASATEGDGDVVVGGNGPDDTADNDVLDLRGAGPVTIVSSADGSDSGALTGTVTFENGETLEFSQIETILRDPGPVDGLNSGESMTPGYTDLQGDQIDGTDGDDDTIFGNGGDDTIDSGLGDDTVDGGAGDDVFDINDEGDGIDNDVIIGGETDETVGDRLDASDIGDDLYLDITAPEEGTLTDGTDTTEFEEIEMFTLGDGDDTVAGSDGGDHVDAGDGDNEMDGDDGDDTLISGDGDDTITGGDGSDSIESGGGDDVIDTSGSSDLLDDKNGDGFGFGSYGPFPPVPEDTDPDDDRDYVEAGAGNDTITTGDDADTIDGGSGDDVIDSGIDNDEILGQAGHDTITSGEGADTVDGGSGNDVIYGGLGPNAPDELNIPDDGSFPNGGDPDTENGRDLLMGNRGNDLIYGEDDDDTLHGGTGADTLDGGIDDDLMYGDEGQDDLHGGQGADTMFGGDDRDEFFVGATREDAFGDEIDGGTGGNDVDTLDLSGQGFGAMEVVNETVDADGDSTSGTVNFLNADGTIAGSLDFTEIENLIICFTPGSRIATPRGEVAVQDLQAGDRVITRDDGVQEIQWIGRKKLTAQDLMADPKLRPVLIKQGSLGNGLPERDMMVSPNHRMLIANSQTHMLFDEREVLVAAKHLVGQPGIHQVDSLGTEYIHVMFDRHEVILGDGAWTESFQPGDYSLAGIDGDQRDEIIKLFPDLQHAEGRQAYGAARQSLKAHEARMLRQSMGLK